jgi:hypothetical protein
MAAFKGLSHISLFILIALAIPFSYALDWYMEVLHHFATRLQRAKMSLKNALKQHRGEIIKIAARHGVHNIRIFGSVEKETEGPDSDVEFLVDLDKGRSLLDLGGMAIDLQQLLGRKVDIVTEKGLHWYIKETILNEAEPL